MRMNKTTQLLNIMLACRGWFWQVLRGQQQLETLGAPGKCSSPSHSTSPAPAAKKRNTVLPVLSAHVATDWEYIKYSNNSKQDTIYVAQSSVHILSPHLRGEDQLVPCMGFISMLHAQLQTDHDNSFTWVNKCCVTMVLKVDPSLQVLQLCFLQVIIGSWECAECHQTFSSWVGSRDKTINPEAVTDCLFCMTQQFPSPNHREWLMRPCMGSITS